MNGVQGIEGLRRSDVLLTLSWLCVPPPVSSAAVTWLWDQGAGSLGLGGRSTGLQGEFKVLE